MRKSKKAMMLLLGIPHLMLAQVGKTVLYQSKAFSVYDNRVEQGKYRAIAESDKFISSDYQSPANEFFKPEITFKFSINGKDNEAPSGLDHKEILNFEKGKIITVRRTFGKTEQQKWDASSTVPYLPANTPVIFELDMRPVLNAFEKEGFYTDFRGDKIYKSDFKGVWIAGGTFPLKWDFDNLINNKNLQLSDPDKDGIYSTELIFNSVNPSAQKASEWKASLDVSRYPSLKSKFLLMDALFNMSLEEMLLDVRQDQTFMAGKEWDGVWTRDISYSIILSLAMIEPQISKNSLLKKVKNKRIIQDTGTGGSWPVSTDRAIWSIAAWEVYKATGDTAWLADAYEIILNSIEDDLKIAFNPETGLFYGESSFLDWREQTYPTWMEPVDIYRSHCLGTNAVFYQTLIVLNEMQGILGIKKSYEQTAINLRKAINEKLWDNQKQYYGQYLYGQHYYSLSPRSEALGEALCLLYNIADSARKNQVLKSTPLMEYGVPTIYPQIPGIPPYHNQSVWPFVQAYWTLAAARNKNEAIVEHGLASMFRQAALFLTNKENMVLTTGDFKGTEINSSRQLWSVAGNLAMTTKVIFGMEMEPDGLHFKPFIPGKYDGSYTLENFTYRKANLNITIEGFGDAIASFEIDGIKTKDFLIPSSLSGNHLVKIVMNKSIQKSQLHLVEHSVSPDMPDVRSENLHLSWNKIKDARAYRVYHNGQLKQELENILYDIEPNAFGEYQISAIDFSGTESFLCKPVNISNPSEFKIVEAEEFSGSSNKSVHGFLGNGFVELDKTSDFKFNLIADSDGEYILKFRYANGNGPINTDNKCGIRALYCNGNYSAAAVFPQRGTNEWSDWGYSNPILLILNRGVNYFELKYNSFTQNMNMDVNGFFIDQVVLIKK